MQKKNPYLPLTIIVILTFLLSGCGQTTQPESESSKIDAGITLHEEQDAFIRELFRDVFVLIQQEDSPYTDLILEMQDSNSDLSKQDSKIQRFLDLQYQVICVDPVDRTLAASLIQEVQKADIPLLFFNRMPADTDLQLYEKAFYLGTDAKKTAALQAEIVLDAYRKDEKSIDRNEDGMISYAVLEGEQGDQNTAIYTEYSVKALEEAGLQMEKTAGGIANADRSQAKELVAHWLEQEDFYAELILANHDAMALGALDAIEDTEEFHADRIQVVGIGGIEEAKAAVDEGRMLGTVFADKQEYAGIFLDTIRALGSGENISGLLYADGKYIWIPTQKYVTVHAMRAQ